MTHEQLDLILRFREARLRTFTEDKPTAILHVVPATAVTAPPPCYDLSIIEKAGILPIWGGANTEYNLLGLVKTGDSGDVQVFHDGSVEAWATLTGKEFHPRRFAGAIVDCLARCLQPMIDLLRPGFTDGTDVAVMLSFLGTGGLVVAFDQTSTTPLPSSVRFPVSVFTLSRMHEAMVTAPGKKEPPNWPRMAAKPLRPILNCLWNAGGVPRCDLYGEDGEWQGQ